MRPDVVCLGESMAQLVPADGKPLRSAESFVLTTAGAESNVAQGLAQLGSTAAWVSLVGDDALGSRVLADVAASGVDVSLTRRRDRDRTGLFLKDPAADGSRVTYYRDGSAASHLSRADVDRAFAARPRHLHLSGVTPALSASCRDAVRYALSSAHGVSTSFDVNHRPVLWPDPRAAALTLRALAQRADVVFVGLDEAAALWGTTTPEQVRELLAEPAAVVVKDGAVDATAFTTEGRFTEPAPPVDVVEPVGAGDAFAAGWLHGMLIGLPHPARLRLGHLMAGAALTSLSDHGTITRPPGDLVREADRATAAGS
ncbi:sugar kinase [Umezawaea endophytica]|uniref:Sugar kinase n=1 Tax=Umezawaea endophytica TaxID=1654476 RepID=A0A9X2VGC8_9PSEU|nr:sugar kinase [Umezawaea endophytica]MCS7475629.1 sugar kinase [Umezawaea endophytica]